jgi:hypothetical protein
MVNILNLLTLDMHEVASIPAADHKQLALQNEDTSQRIQTE